MLLSHNKLLGVQVNKHGLEVCNLLKHCPLLLAYSTAISFFWNDLLSVNFNLTVIILLFVLWTVFQLLKTQSIVGQYDALVAHVDMGAIGFFKRHELTDDLLLNDKFKY